MMAQRLGLPFLGAIPLNMAVRQFSDAGTPRRNFTDAGETMQQSPRSSPTRSRCRRRSPGTGWAPADRRST